MAISPADLFLSPSLTEVEAQQYLRSAGFRDPGQVDEHLQAMADDPIVRQALGTLADRLFAALLESASPDAAVAGFSRYLAARSGRTAFLGYLRDDPKALDAIARVLGGSPFLADILIRHPEYFHWLVPRIDRGPADPRDLEDGIEHALATAETPAEALDALKAFKRRQVLRIAARELLGRDGVAAAAAQLSDLAGVIIDRVLSIVAEPLLAAEKRADAPGAFAVIGTGNLGGREPDYRSDIGLLYVYEPRPVGDPSAHAFFQRLGRTLTAAFAEQTRERDWYRVDVRGAGGPAGTVAGSLTQCVEHYATCDTFERIALIKAEPVAGDRDLGRRFVEMVQPFVYRSSLDHAVLDTMHREDTGSDRARRTDGGIRDIEVFTQVLQLTFGGSRPELRRGNTCAAIGALAAAGIIPRAVGDDLTAAYVFLRAVEHRLQLAQEAETPTVPDPEVEAEIAARRLGVRSVEEFHAELGRHRRRAHEICGDVFECRRGAGSLGVREPAR